MALTLTVAAPEPQPRTPSYADYALDMDTPGGIALLSIHRRADGACIGTVTADDAEVAHHAGVALLAAVLVREAP